MEAQTEPVTEAPEKDAAPEKAKRKYTKKAPPPRLGTPASGKWLVDTILKAYPDAKPSDWRAVNTMIQYALRCGGHWGKNTRKT